LVILVIWSDQRADAAIGHARFPALAENLENQASLRFVKMPTE